MKFKDHVYPTADELRTWASSPEAVWPSPAWDFELCFSVDVGRVRLFGELAADESLPQHRFFLYMLYYWLERQQRGTTSSGWREIYSRWLSEIRFPRNRDVRQWRHDAKLILDGAQKFDSTDWWAHFAATSPADDDEAS